MTGVQDFDIGEPITSDESDQESEILQLKDIMKQHGKHRGPINAFDEKASYQNRSWSNNARKFKFNVKSRNNYKHRHQRTEKSNNQAASRFGSASSIIIKQHLRCPICNEIFNNPVILPCCGASCCKECISQDVNGETCDQNVDSFKCFECSSSINLDDVISNSALQKSVSILLNKGLNHNQAESNTPLQIIPPGTIRSVNVNQNIVPLGGRVARVLNTVV